LRLELLGTLITFGAALSAVLAKSKGIDPGAPRCTPADTRTLGMA